MAIPNGCVTHSAFGSGLSANWNFGYMDCPIRVWLESPLGDRAVIDLDTDEELPLFVPEYLNNVVQPDHGYHPAQRRLRRRGSIDETGQ